MNRPSLPPPPPGFTPSRKRVVVHRFEKRGPTIGGETFAPGYTKEAALYEQQTRTEEPCYTCGLPLPTMTPDEARKLREWSNGGVLQHFACWCDGLGHGGTFCGANAAQAFAQGEWPLPLTDREIQAGFRALLEYDYNAPSTECDCERCEDLRMKGDSYFR
jgi:hypothetical protein